MMNEVRIAGMRNLISLTEFQDRVHDWSEENFDIRADSKDMLFHMEDEIEVFEKLNGLDAWSGVNERMNLSDNAKGQLCDRFALPARYMFDEKWFPPELRKDCFEYKFKSMPQENQLIRGRHSIDGELCRAVLTRHYRPYDNQEFIDAIVEAVSVKGVDPRTVKVGSWTIGSDMRGIGILPNIRFDQWGNGGPPTADGGGSGGLHPGFKFGNSEIGRSRTRIAGGGWRSFCENGVIYGWNSKAEFSVVHRGQKVMSLMVNEGIADALILSEEGSRKYMEKMVAQVEKTDIGDIIELWSSKYGFTVESTEAWKTMVEAEVTVHGEISEFDVINSLTYVARDEENDEYQENLQIAAGDMVFVESISSLPRSR
jgi:hypothetical protein